MEFVIALSVLSLVLLISLSDSFVVTTNPSKPWGTTTPFTTTLPALTERQMQFWEDVEEGLDDIEAFYESKGQSIERIRQFGKSARGEIEAPSGDGVGHEPSEEHVDGLTARPFWNVTADSGKFPWAAELEANAHLIASEFREKLLPNNNESSMFASDSAWQTKVMGDGWSAVRLQRLGEWNVENCNEFPKTYLLLQQLNIPLAVRGVCFARQAPQSGVQPHSDGRNFILTSHLGLSIPEGCWIKVGEETQTWQPGKLTTLDTSFVHSTGNPSNEERHVLILDFWHPELSEGERAALEFIYDLRNQFESGKVPYRKPKSLQEKNEGFVGLWNAITGQGD